MKSILVAMLLIVSSTVFAAPRLPTDKEIRDIKTLLESNKSIQPLINAFKSNTITPFYEFRGPETIYVPGKSRAVGYLMKRFSLDSPLGIESENLELLKFFLDQGLNPNIGQGSPYDTSEEISLMTLAAIECAVPAVDLLASKGARMDLEEDYWLITAGKGYQYDPGSNEDIRCSSLTSRFLDSVEKLSLRSSYILFSGTFSRLSNRFMRGFMLYDGYTQEIKDKMTAKFELKPSKMPTSEERSEKWFEFFTERFAYPSELNDQGGPDLYRNWWDKYTNEEKEWACFYSSFDEHYFQLKKLGYTDEEIMTKKILGDVRYGAIFGRFAVEIFVPYCDSIRN